MLSSGHIVKRDKDHHTNKVRQFKVGGEVKMGKPKKHMGDDGDNG